MMPLFALLLAGLAAAAPFVTSWITTKANEIIELPEIFAQSDLTINWGDSTPAEPFATGRGVLNHTFASPTTYTVSIEGQFYWASWSRRADTASSVQFVDIVSWGDGIRGASGMFGHFPNLKVSAPPNTQPMFPPGTSLNEFFTNTRFNSSLDWDLLNVGDITDMFSGTPLNQPITFRNTQGVQSIRSLFARADQFNQPFHFDASSVITTRSMFQDASSFNSILNLSNPAQLLDTSSMFEAAKSFNQPITFSTNLVKRMDAMFKNASRFNQPVPFDTGHCQSLADMFYSASSFNQPINFNTPFVFSTAGMFFDAVAFNQSVTLDTASVTNMSGMFSGASSFASTVNFTATDWIANMDHMFDGADNFTQDLSAWAPVRVIQCDSFCSYCGLPVFACFPCSGGRWPTNNEHGMRVCYETTPSVAPSAAPPSAAVSPATVAVGLLVLALGSSL